MRRPADKIKAMAINKYGTASFHNERLIVQNLVLRSGRGLTGTARFFRIPKIQVLVLLSRYLIPYPGFKDTFKPLNLSATDYSTEDEFFLKNAHLSTEQMRQILKRHSVDRIAQRQAVFIQKLLQMRIIKYDN